MDMNNYMERSTVLVEALPYIQKWYGKDHCHHTAATP